LLDDEEFPAMLTILGKPQNGFCDGLSRRSFLKIGGLALGGMSLPQILKAESVAGVSPSHKAIIMVFLPGGPPHQDFVDLKMDAPAEVRGEFKPIKTNVPGIEICEHFPLLAQRMDKLIPIRSVVGASGAHDAYECVTGRRRRGQQPPGGWPALGSVLSKVRGPGHPSMPAFVGLSPKMGHMEWADNGPPGFLGVAHAPFKPDGEGKADMVLNGVTLDRLGDRQALLTSFDRFRRDADASGMAAGMDTFYQQSFDILSSKKLSDALDVTREDPRVPERYGAGTPALIPGFNAAPRLTQQFLLARRLVEAGARCVTLAFGGWDWHATNFLGLRGQLPYFDQGMSALVDDLHERGLDKDVLVVAWGEMGRSPRVNKDAGRDHWPAVSGALLAGGGLRTGQVIGATTRLGDVPRDRPVHNLEIFATIYHHLGIDRSGLTLTDLSGRPQNLIDSYEPVKELL
jgi:hypothetical protein